MLSPHTHRDTTLENMTPSFSKEGWVADYLSAVGHRFLLSFSGLVASFYWSWSVKRVKDKGIRDVLLIFSFPPQPFSLLSRSFGKEEKGAKMIKKKSIDYSISFCTRKQHQVSNISGCHGFRI